MRLSQKYQHIMIGMVISIFLSLLVFFPKNHFRAGYTPGLESAIVVFLQCVFIWITVQQVILSKKINSLGMKIFLSCIIGFFIVISLLLLFSRVTGWNVYNKGNVAVGRRFFVFAFFRSIIITAFLFFIAYLLFVSKEAERLKRDGEIIKKENLEARLFALQQQINPHFLFNALNTLYSIAQDKETRKYVLNFSNVFRYQLNQNRAMLATLQEELAFTNAYLHILKERFEEALRIQIDIPDVYMDRKTPPVAMQMLIENAIKHNIVSEEKPLALHIYTEGEMLVVQNNIQHKNSKETSIGVGLNNIEERYELLAHKQIEVIREADNFIVKIPLL